MPGLPVSPVLLAFLLACAAIPAQAQSFSSACGESCAEHEAGYSWAAENKIGEADLCSGYSTPFVEGCFAWMEEQKQKEEPVTVPVAVEAPENGYYE